METCGFLFELQQHTLSLLSFRRPPQYNLTLSDAYAAAGEICAEQTVTNRRVICTKS